MFKQYKGLPREVYILFTANVINRFGDFVSPLITLYLTQKLYMSPKEASIIVMIVLFTRFPGAVVGGKIADHFGRKETYILMQTLAGATLIACAFVVNENLIITLLIISTFINGAARPALDALAIDLLPDDKRSLGMALMYLGINIGVAVGPAIAGILFEVNIQLFFIFDGVTSFIAVIMVMLLISQKYISKSTYHDNKKSEKYAKHNTFQYMKENIKLTIFIVFFSAFALVYVQIKFSMPLLFSVEFGENSSTYMGLMFTVNALTVIFFTTKVTNLTEKNPHTGNVAIGGLFMAIGFSLFGILNGLFSYLIATFVWTIGEILLHINGKVYIANQTPANLRGRVNGVYSSLIAIANTIGVIVAGRLIPVVGTTTIWLIIGIFSIICSAGIVIVNYEMIFKRESAEVKKEMVK